MFQDPPLCSSTVCLSSYSCCLPLVLFLSFVRLPYNTSRLSFCQITPIVRTSVVFLLSSSSFRLFSCRLLRVAYSSVVCTSVVYPSVVYPSVVLLLLSSAWRLTSVLSLPVVLLLSAIGMSSYCCQQADLVLSVCHPTPVVCLYVIPLLPFLHSC